MMIFQLNPYELKMLIFQLKLHIVHDNHVTVDFSILPVSLVID